MGRNDKAYYILRPCMVHGPGNKGNLNLFYKFITKGLPYPLAAFDNKRSFLSIENFSFIVKSLLSNKVESGVYNMADDEPMSTLQLFSTIAAASGRKEKVWRIPAKLVSWVARLGDTFKLPLNTERLNKLTENYVVSNKKIKSALISSIKLTNADNNTAEIRYGKANELKNANINIAIGNIIPPPLIVGVICELLSLGLSIILK